MTKNHDKNGLFVLGGLETQLHDILWAVHDGKNMVEARARKISGGGWSGRSDARFSRTRTHVGARRWALTERERLHCRLCVTETERSIDDC